GHEVVNDCIEVALLARGLERPRTDVDGHFARANRIANEHGTQHQKLRAAYNRAWTTFWWYEDYKAFADVYQPVEEFAKDTWNAYDLELLSNLWVCLHAIAKRGEIDEATAKLQTRTQFLETQLERLSQEEGRPSTVLQARTFLVNIRLQKALFAGG